VHITKISAELNVMVKVTGQKKPKECCILLGRHPLGCGCHAALFLGAVLGGSTPVGKSAHAL